jgi:GDP-D-mannose 3',5'-epimerase
MKKAIITGAGGFIGSHLTNFLKKKGYYVKGIDLKKPEFSTSQADEFIIADLRDPKQANKHITNADELYMLAADMGGIGFISCNNSQIVHNSSLINLNSLENAAKNRINKIFYSSSACIYPEEKQLKTKNTGLKESDAYPANPDTTYGWEKLFIEQACLAYANDYNIDIKIARFHNIYGPEGTFQGGREKSPAAICRKIALAKKNGQINVWGDGKQTRSYCYIDDCCEGVFKLMNSDNNEPINIGSDRLVTINQLVDIIAKISKKKISKEYDLTKPQGVRGRNSDNTLLKETLNWEPNIPLEEGLEETYNWIKSQLSK